jgi:hypothetical protein
MLVTPCKIWTGSRTGGRGRQYGQTPQGNLAHRDAYTKNIGLIPEGMHVLHICDNPLCYEYTHLKLGTAKDNAQDKAIRGRDCRKLTILQVHEIRASLLSQNKLADIYGVSSTLIGQIKRGTRRQFV